MTTEEADALFLSGLPGPPRSSAWGRSSRPRGSRCSRRCPTELRGRASRLLERFHLDAAGWFRAGESRPPPRGDRAVRLGRPAPRARLRARRRDRDPDARPARASCSRPASGTSSRAHDGQIRTYRVSRVRGVAPLPEHATERRPGFDLATYWSESITAFERDAPRIEVTLRVRRERARAGSRTSSTAPALAAAVDGARIPSPTPGGGSASRSTGLARSRAGCSRSAARWRSWRRPSCGPRSPRWPRRRVARYREPARRRPADRGRISALTAWAPRAPRRWPGGGCREPRRDARRTARAARSDLALAVGLDGLRKIEHVKHGSPRPHRPSDTPNPSLGRCQLLS